MQDGLKYIYDPELAARAAPDSPTLFKIGARTGGSTGQFNSIKAKLLNLGGGTINNPESSTEYVLYGRRQDLDRTGRFSLPGDSGAWVFDNNSNRFGMVMAVQKLDSE